MEKLFLAFDTNARNTMPMSAITKFAIATAMRLDEIVRIEWQHLDQRTRTVLVEDRKDPRRKDCNNQRVPLLAVTGFDAYEILEEQRRRPGGARGRRFPYNGRSVGTNFRRTCQDIGIEDLRKSTLLPYLSTWEQPKWSKYALRNFHIGCLAALRSLDRAQAAPASALLSLLLQLNMEAAMESDAIIRELVIEEMARDPSVTADGIGVTVHNGVVTLTGHVPSFSERNLAARIAQRVCGTKAVAQELLVRLPDGKKRADDEIAGRAVKILDWTLHDTDNIKVTVDGGWVTLTGEVDWGYQKKDAERAIHMLGGVTGVYNNIRVRPRVDPDTIREAICKAFRRTAEQDGAGITVVVDGSTVTLSGNVSGWHERQSAEDAAWAVPGVSEVHDKLLVT